MVGKSKRGGNAAVEALKYGELAAASAEVIGRRVIGAALGDDPAEAGRMVSEKAEAFARAAAAAAPHVAEMNLRAAGHALDETARAVAHVGRLSNSSPAHAAGLQAAYVMDAFGRATAFWSGLAATGAKAQAAALAPVLKTATANVRRLRG